MIAILQLDPKTWHRHLAEPEFAAVLIVVTCLRFPVRLFLVLSLWHLLYLEMEVSRKEMIKLLIDLTRRLENTFDYCATLDRRGFEGGAMGKVYWVSDRTKALKQADPKANGKGENDYLTVFLRELGIPLLCDHPLCMKPDAYGFFGWNTLDNSTPAQVYSMVFPKMESSLAEVDESVSRVERMEILYTIARAMVDLHDAEIVHRDLKPANILLGKNHKAFLADFGSSRLLVGQDTTATGRGTPLYSDPQDPYHVSKANDVYSFGRIFYVLMFGKLMVGQGQLLGVCHDKAPKEASYYVEEFRKKFHGNYEIQSFFEEVLDDDRQKRLTFREVVERLKNDEKILFQFAEQFQPWTKEEKEEYQAYIQKTEAELQNRPKMRPNVSHDVVTSAKAPRAILDAGDSGDLSAEVNAALLLQAGKGTKEDPVRALRYLLSVRRQCPDDPMFRFLDAFKNGTPLQRGVYQEIVANEQKEAGNMQEASRHVQEAAKFYREGALAGDRACIELWADLLESKGAGNEARQLRPLLNPRKR